MCTRNSESRRSRYKRLGERSAELRMVQQMPSAVDGLQVALHWFLFFEFA